METVPVLLVVLAVLQTHLVCVSQAGAVPGVTDNSERLAYDLIFGDYSSAIRPRNFPLETVDVNITLDLKQLVGFDEVNQQIQTQVTVIAEWLDDFLVWHPAQFGGLAYMVVPATRVWRPDFGLSNSAGDFYKEDYWKNYRVEVQYTGYVIWTYGGIFTTSCTMDISDYPFDTQTCTIILSNWQYFQEDVDLICTHTEAITTDYSADGQWELKSTNCTKDPQVLSGDEGIILGRVKFQLVFKRKPWWFTLNIILPTIFMITLALMMFWLPADSGEKIGMGVTILLAFSVFQLLIASEIPKTSDTTPMLSAMMLFVMVMTTFSIMNTILVLRLHHHPASRRAPKFLRNLAFNILAPVLCLKFMIPQVDMEEDEVADEEVPGVQRVKSLEEFKNDFAVQNGLANGTAKHDPGAPAVPIGPSPMSAILGNVKDINTILKNNVKSDDITEEWQTIGAIWERFVFCIVFLVVAVFMPAYILQAFFNG